MLNNKSIGMFFKSDNFFKMLQKVGKEDFISYINNNTWLKKHPCTAIIYRDPEMTWDRIKNTYRTTFKDLVIGDLPDENNLVDSLKKIKARMDLFDWEI